MEQLTYAVIGSGNMGKRHLRVAGQIEGVKLVAVVDPDEQKEAIANEYGVKFYPNSEQMFERHRPQIVSVCAPTDAHYSLARLALEAGSHVIVEKPLTSN